MGSSWHNAKFYLRVVPITVLVTMFIVLVGYVSWSIHIFNPVPLRIHMNCGIYEGESGKENLAVYIRNRTVRKEKIGLNNNKCQSIKKRRYLPAAVPHSMEVHHNMYLLRIVSKDYDFLEEVMTMMFSPLHFYCFVIDSSASAEFEKLENEMPIHSIHYIADTARRLGEAARIGRFTIAEEHIRILGDDLDKASAKEQEYLKRAVCSWLKNRRFPIILPRVFQDVLFKFITEQNLEHCQVLSPDFDKNVALEVCHTNHYDEMGNCIVGIEDYDYITIVACSDLWGTDYMLLLFDAFQAQATNNRREQ
ncbi:unnamed protein product [Angiostrongylus costaricensis]|uniref:DUF5672 domain-containing protein n=1 Tax=Angiostrongylus costaricensis TaxID=334426 RepID=A0A158PIG0_ANGCS|nr:unnamed protein product [Angiostrongylus costaricensis]